MVPQLSSITISYLVKVNGKYNQAWSLIYLMEWMDKDQNTAQPDYKDFYISATIIQMLINNYLMNNNFKDVIYKLLPAQTQLTFSMC